MKRIVTVVLALMFLLAGVSCGEEKGVIQAIESRGVVRIGVKTDVPGFGYYNPDTGIYEGMEIDLARAVAKALLGSEQAVEFFGVTPQTRGPMLQNGEIDLVIATFTITEERLKSFRFTNPYYQDEIGLLVRRDSGIDSLSGLGGKTVGVGQSSTAQSTLLAEAESMGVALSMLEFPSYPELKAALVAGKIDAFAVDKSILYGYVDDMTVILAEGFNPQDYGIATALENTQLAVALNDLLSAMTRDGRMAELMARWGLQ